MSNANDMAFPVVLESTRTPNDSEQLGLTKREYFAIKFAAGMASGECEADGYWKDDVLAARAVKRADALLAELAK